MVAAAIVQQVANHSANEKAEHFQAQVRETQEELQRQLEQGISEEKAHKDELERKNEEIQNHILGGNSFAYVRILFDQHGPIWQVLHRGKYPVYDLSIRITDQIAIKKKLAPFEASIRKGISPPFEKLLAADTTLNVGNVANKEVSFWGRLLVLGDLMNFTVDCVARNGGWSENLTAVKVGTKWLMVLRVYRQDDKGQSRIIFEEINPSMPKENASWIAATENLPRDLL